MAAEYFRDYLAVVTAELDPLVDFATDLMRGKTSMKLQMGLGALGVFNGKYDEFGMRRTGFHSYERGSSPNVPDHWSDPSNVSVVFALERSISKSDLIGRRQERSLEFMRESHVRESRKIGDRVFNDTRITLPRGIFTFQGEPELPHASPEFRRALKRGVGYYGALRLTQARHERGKKGSAFTSDRLTLKREPRQQDE